MFTGIVETTGKVLSVVQESENLHLSIYCSFISELKPDQSVAHNGVCLTVTEINDQAYKVTAVKETIERSNLGNLKAGNLINLERCLRLNDRIDGHLVQGHVDTIAKVQKISEEGGSWKIKFYFPEEYSGLLVDKGSVCINGVSLTVITPDQNSFSAAIIPYTWEHTNLCHLQTGDSVNIEFDIIGKYVQRNLR